MKAHILINNMGEKKQQKCPLHYIKVCKMLKKIKWYRVKSDTFINRNNFVYASCVNRMNEIHNIVLESIRHQGVANRS